MSKVVSLGARISLIDRMSSGLNKVVGSLALATKASEKMDSGVKKMAAATTSAASQTSSAMNKVESATSKASKSTKQMGEEAQKATGKVISFEEAQKRAARAAEVAAKKTEKLRQEYAGLSAETATVLKKMDNASGAFQATGTALTAAGAGVAYGFGSSVKSAADFEQQMSSIKALTGATGSEMKKISALAIEAGESTKFSAVEAGMGIEELLKAGVSLTDVMGGGLKGALDLAVAGELQLADAAEIASTALNAFKNDNLSVVQAGNILSGAANASATSVGELKYGLAAVSAVASGVGMTFTDTSTALALFAQNGLKGSDAGTSLKTMIANLSPMTDDAASQMEKLGLLTEKGTSAFYDAKGNVKSMAEIADLLQTSLKGLNGEQRQQALYTMFGSDAIRAANILYKEGAAGVEQMGQAMSKVTAADVASEKLNNFNGALEMLKGAFETTKTSIGTLFLPALTDIVKFVGKAVDAFNSLPAPVKNTFVAFTAIAGVAMLIGGPLLLLMGFLPSIVSGFGLMAGAVSMSSGALLSTIGVAFGWVAAIAAIGVALVVAYKKSETFREIVNRAFSAVSNVVGKAVSAIKSLAKDVFTQILNWWKKDGEMIKQAVSNVVNFFISAWNKIAPAVTVIFQIFKMIVGSAWDSIKALFKSGVGIITSVINIFAALFIGNWKALWENVKSLLKNALVFAWNLVQLTFLGRILGPIRAGMGFIKSILLAGWTFVKGIFTKSLSGIVNIVKFNFNFLKTIVQTGMNIIRTVIRVAWTFIKGVFQAGMQFLRGNWSAGWQFIKSTFISIFNVVKNALVTGFNFMKEKASAFFNTLKDLINTAKTKFGEFKTKVVEVMESFKTALSNAGEKIAGFFSPLISFIDSAKTKWGEFKEAISSFKMPSFKLPSFGGWGKGKEDGRAYTGLRRVPFDGFKAVLHRNETVLNANEADIYRRYGLNNPNHQAPIERSKPTSFRGSKPSMVSNTNNSNKSEALVKIDVGGVTITASEIDAMSKDDTRFKETAEKLLDYLADKLDEAARNIPDVTKEALL